MRHVRAVRPRRAVRVARRDRHRAVRAHHGVKVDRRDLHREGARTRGDSTGSKPSRRAVARVAIAPTSATNRAPGAHPANPSRRDRRRAETKYERGARHRATSRTLHRAIAGVGHHVTAGTLHRVATGRHHRAMHSVEAHRGVILAGRAHHEMIGAARLRHAMTGILPRRAMNGVEALGARIGVPRRAVRDAVRRPAFQTIRGQHADRATNRGPQRVARD